MPKGIVKSPKWTQKQREIYHMVVDLGKTRSQIYKAGYGKDNIECVMRAIFRKEKPPDVKLPDRTDADLFSGRDVGDRLIKAMAKVFQHVICIEALLKEKDEEILCLKREVKNLTLLSNSVVEENDKMRKRLANSAKVVFGEK